MPTSCKVSVFILLGKSRLIMIVKDAQDVAHRWVIKEAGKAPGFDGAFYAGSTNWLPDDAVFPSTSDVDVWVVLADPDLLAKPGKFIYRDVILDVSYLPSDQVTAWLFATGVTTHVLLVAGLRNPTMRRRYVAARDLLVDYGHLEFYETLLEVLGCAQMGRERVEHHLTALTDMFDAAKAVVKTPFFFASDISDIARPIAIDGSWDLVERGYHREGIFWMVATYSRCQKVLYHDAPAEIQDRFSPGYRQLLGDLGITSFADLQQRSEQLKGLLPRVWEVTEAILAANPGIEDKRG
jgi:hypothetical protein